MQDWAYVWRGAKDITMELSTVKWPPGSQLPSFWESNRESMLAYLERARRRLDAAVAASARAVALRPLDAEAVSLQAVYLTEAGRAREAASLLARALGGRPFTVEGGARVLYHLAASLGANGLTVRVAASRDALVAAGLDAGEALEALGPLLRTALEEALSSGPTTKVRPGTIMSKLRLYDPAPEKSCCRRFTTS